MTLTNLNFAQFLCVSSMLRDHWLKENEDEQDIFGRTSRNCNLHWGPQGHSVTAMAVLLHSLLRLHDYITRRTSGSISVTALDHIHHLVYFMHSSTARRKRTHAIGSGTLLPEMYRVIPARNVVFGGTPTTVHDLAYTSRAVGDWWNHVTSVHDATVLSDVHGQ